jgi:isoleucyl-tRNA synthetase
VNYELKPNFKAIGAKFRESVPHIKEALSKANAADLRAQFAASGKINLPLASGKSTELSPEEVEVSLKAKEGYAAASGRTVVVVLDTHLTPELLDEGVARELISRINEWRGDLKLPYEQRIKLAVKGSAKLEGVAKKFAEHIAKETLAAEQAVGDTPSGYETLDVEVDGEKATLALKRV